ncbi:GntR family transcriptional regulator [Pengzhenrongella phosphoraccumulans]|uniref:GntR family transcriptional regulator n=1 Tax=Pengzhenrongella phosphoraccumulans TaxID=3114394 RepID=UPI00388DF845
MSLQLEVDLASGVPPYEQIRSQVVAHASAGRLRAGDRLPTIRALATDLGVAAGTVARAYRELEASGVVATRRRTGTVVAAGAPAADDALGLTAAVFVAAARAAGLGDEAVLDLVRGALLAPERDR